MAVNVSAQPILRLVIDINVWISFLMATRLGRTGTAAQAIVSLAHAGAIADRRVQLVFSMEMIDTLGKVLRRLEYPASEIPEFGQSLVKLMRTGPERLDPHLLLSGRDQLGMHDREDAGVLATAIAAKAHVLVTDNLRDFETNDSQSINTRRLTSAQGGRQLFAIIQERQDGVALVVAHPIDVLTWMREGTPITPTTIRQSYAG